MNAEYLILYTIAFLLGCVFGSLLTLKYLKRKTQQKMDEMMEVFD